MSCAQTGSGNLNYTIIALKSFYLTGKTAAFLVPVINRILMDGPGQVKPVS
jgi:hypothetical protein